MVSNETLVQIGLRLKQLGYDPDKHPIEDLPFYANLVYDEVTTNLCRDTIPPKLYRVYIDMVCGEFLYDKYNKGELDYLFDPNNVEPGAITSVKVGNVSVGMSSNRTTRVVFEDYINKLRKQDDLRYLFDFYRDYFHD